MAILERHIIFLNITFYVETLEEDFMYGFKLGWIVPIVVLITLFAVIWLGIYQLNSDGNDGALNDNTISSSVDWR